MAANRRKPDPPTTPEKKSTKDTHMTDMKKTAEDNAPAKGKKLQLNKETLQDLGPSNPSQVKGGRNVCTAGYSGCTQSGE